MSLDEHTYVKWVNIAHLTHVTEGEYGRFVHGGHLDQIICGGYDHEGGQGYIGWTVFNEVLDRIINNVEPDRTEYATLTCEEAMAICRPLFEKTIRDLVSSVTEAPDKLYKAEIARRLGCGLKATPVLERSHAWVPNNLMAIVKALVPGFEEIKRGSRICYSFTGSGLYELPKPHDFKYNIKSKMEERTHVVLKRMAQRMGYVVFRESKTHLSDMVKKSPWDFLLYKEIIGTNIEDYELVGMIEVDGEHHYKKCLFNSAPGAWDKRQAFDREKDRLALAQSGRECLRIRGNLREWPMSKLEKAIAKWMVVKRDDA